MVHEGPKDPNAALNRLNLKPFEIQTNIKNSTHQLDYRFYGPTLTSRIETRRLFFRKAIAGYLEASRTIEGVHDEQTLLHYLEKTSPEVANVVSAIRESGFGIFAFAPELLSASAHELVSLRRPNGNHEESVEKKRPRLLRTHEEYLAYFKSFETKENQEKGAFPVLRKILSQITFIEITKGCSGPCASICISPVGPVEGQMPFQTLEWIFRNFSDVLKEIRPCLYDGSNMGDYRDQGKTGIDVMKLYYECLGFYPYTSLVFPRNNDEEGFEFLYQWVTVHRLPLDRISRLVTGRMPGNKKQGKEGDYDLLLRKIRERCKRDGRGFSRRSHYVPWRAFAEGRKDDVDVRMGNAVKSHLPESKMSADLVNCRHGITFGCEGFAAEVVKPTSRLFPWQRIIYPLRFEDAPEGKTLEIPTRSHIDDVVYPIRASRNVDHYVQGPKFMKIDQEGAVSPPPHPDRLSASEELLQEYLKALEKVDDDMRDFFFIFSIKQSVPFPKEVEALLHECLESLLGHLEKFSSWTKKECQKKKLTPEAKEILMYFLKTGKTLGRFLSNTALFFKKRKEQYERRGKKMDSSSAMTLLRIMAQMRAINTHMKPRMPEITRFQEGLFKTLKATASPWYVEDEGPFDVETEAFGNPQFLPAISWVDETTRVREAMAALFESLAS